MENVNAGQFQKYIMFIFAKIVSMYTHRSSVGRGNPWISRKQTKAVGVVT